MKMVLMSVAVALAFCSCSTPEPAPTQTMTIQELKAVNRSVRGGDGSSLDTAIVLTEKTPAAIRQEYVIFRILRGTGPAGQGLLEKDGHHYDVLVGEDERALYFDITAYWKHTYGK